MDTEVQTVPMPVGQTVGIQDNFAEPADLLGGLVELGDVAVPDEMDS